MHALAARTGRESTGGILGRGKPPVFSSSAFDRRLGLKIECSVHAIGL